MTIVHEHWIEQATRRLEIYRDTLLDKTFTYKPYTLLTGLEPLECFDGTKISIQAGVGLYSSPRETFVEWDMRNQKWLVEAPYTEWEIWVDGEALPKPYVCTNEIINIINEHGGPVNSPVLGWKPPAIRFKSSGSSGLEI